MNDTRYDIWLGIGSVILILMLVASFTAVFRAALSAHSPSPGGSRLGVVAR